MRYLFKNNKSHTVKLPGKDGRLVHFAVKEQKALDEYFKRYVPKYLSVLRIVNDNKKIDVKKTSANRSIKIVRPKNTEKKKSNAYISNKIIKSSGSKGRKKVLVGRASRSGRIDATKFSKARISENSIPISNNIGIGVLSYNRLDSLIHLIESIRKHTDLNKTTVFVSDESTDSKVWEWLSKQKDIVTFHSERKGIAVNSNRLLRCLSRFKYKIILNDDVEVLRNGWDSFYFEYMEKHTNIKHFCYRQEGIYGANRPRAINNLIAVSEKPHGAVLAIHDDAFRKVGYFDESFGTYGFEHVDYSDRIARSCHNDSAYYDLNGSDKYFKIYDDNTSDANKHSNYAKAKNRYNEVSNDKSRIYINTSDSSKVPGITYIIPFRDIGRQDCIKTVTNNIKAQRYPEVQIILSEQDSKSRINISKFSCVDHILVKNWYDGMHFCKSASFNKAVEHAKFNKMILHDADMLVRADYSVKISSLLDDFESAHIGSTVCYMDKESTDKIVKNQSIDKDNISSDRVVGYYEGGSFGIMKNAYIRIGGFCDDFIGYGCEDCEFYNRMSKGTRSYTKRSIDLFHLWHDRTDGWIERHDINKNIQSKMFKEDFNSLCNRLRRQLISKYKNL